MDKSYKNIITAAVVFGFGYVIAKLLRPKKDKNLDLNKRYVDPSKDSAGDEYFTHLELPSMSTDFDGASVNPRTNDALEALTAYIQALNERWNEKKMDELSKELERDYNLKIMKRRVDKKLVVQDLKGNDIMVYPS